MTKQARCFGVRVLMLVQEQATGGRCSVPVPRQRLTALAPPLPHCAAPPSDLFVRCVV